jgi:hypothetical protein
MDLYFDAYAAEQRRTGQALALQDVIELLDVVLDGAAESEMQSVIAGYDGTKEQELFIRFFDNLRLLLN